MKKKLIFIILGAAVITACILFLIVTHPDPYENSSDDKEDFEIVDEIDEKEDPDEQEVRIEKVEYDANGDLKPEYLLGQWGRPSSGFDGIGIVYFRDDNTLTFYDLNPDDPDGVLVPSYNGTWKIEGHNVITEFDGHNWVFYFKDDAIYDLFAEENSQYVTHYVRSDKGILPDQQ